MRGDDAGFARQVWQRMEAIHAVTYFAPECIAANRAVGLRGFWMGYFASRAAPLGPVGAGVVEATFYNFHPAMVARAIPDAWTFAEPEAILASRRSAAAAALRAACPGVDDLAADLADRLAVAIATAVAAAGPCSSPTATSRRVRIRSSGCGRCARRCGSIAAMVTSPC